MDVTQTDNQLDRLLVSQPFKKSKSTYIHYFFETCNSCPHSTAVITGTHTLSYQQLKSAAIQVHGLLKEIGVKQSQLVAICISRSTDLVATILGCILHGAVFLLVDPCMPTQRIQVLLEIARPCVVFYTTQNSVNIEPVLCASKTILGINVQMQESCFALSFAFHNNKHILESFQYDDDVLYIIFTSGSTGVPKAVCASASGTLNRFEWMWNDFPFQPNDVVCFKTSVNFVDCIWEILGAVLKGSCLAIPLEEEAKDPRLLVPFMKRFKVTRVIFVPSYLRHILEFSTAESLQYLTFCISSGEPLSLSLAAMFLKAASSCRLLNLYGTSEICGDITYFEVTSQYLEQASSSFVPIGKAIPNIIVEVIDPVTENIIPQNSSKEGELVTFGNCVALMYLNSKDKSLTSKGDTRIFNTHDLVHYTSSGDLMYIGRRDHQIKVRGVRINPSEIEATLEKNGIVEKAVVAADESQMNLVGFIQISHNHSNNEPIASIEFNGVRYFTNSSYSEAIVTELLNLLPNYLVPSLYVFTNKLPCLPSGKISRKDLPPTLEIRKLFSECVPESVELTTTEEELCCIFKKILNISSTSSLSNFFALGGNSLSAVHLSSFIQECFQCEISVATILDNPTIQSLALLIDQHSIWNKPNPITSVVQQVIEDNSGPITYSQENTWGYEAMSSCALYDLGVAAICLSLLNVDILQASIHHLSMKHESLRTIYCCTKHGHPFQKVLKYNSPEFTIFLKSAFTIHDCTHECPLKFVDSQVILPFFEFNLLNGPLWKFTLFTNVIVPGEKEPCSVIVFQAHHMITDGWSIQILTADLEEIYNVLFCGGDTLLFAPNPYYFNYAIKHAIAERTRNIDKELQLWSNRLHNALLPPFLYPNCVLTCTYTGSTACTINKTFVIPMTDIRSLSQANDMSEFIPVYTSLLTAFYALNGNIDVITSLMLAIRNSENAKVAMFSVDAFPLRTTFNGDFTLQSLLSVVKTNVQEVMENQISFYQLEKAMMRRGKMIPDSLFYSGVLNQCDVVFEYANIVPFSKSKMFRNIPVRVSAAESLIDFYIEAGPDNLTAHVAYSTALYDKRTLQILLDTWEKVMETMVKHVYLNVPLKRLCGDMFMSEPEQTNKFEENICANSDQPLSQPSTVPEAIALSLNIDDVITWSQLSVIQELLMQFVNSGNGSTLSSVHCPVVFVHVPFSAFAIALIVAATRLKCSLSFFSTLEMIMKTLSNVSLDSVPHVVIVKDSTENEQIKSYCANKCLILTLDSFHSASSPHESYIELKDLTINNKWHFDISVCLEVITRYFTNNAYKAITLTSPESLTLPLAIGLLLQGISVQAYTHEHASLFLKASCDNEVDMVVIQDIVIPSILPNITNSCNIKHLWIHGLSFGLAYISKWIASSHHVQAVSTHSLVQNELLITHHLNLKDIPSFKNDCIPCIPLGCAIKRLSWKVLHRDGRNVLKGFIGSFVTQVCNGKIHQSTSVVRQHPDSDTFELVSVNAETYYKGIDVTPALCVLSTIPEISWCGISQSTEKDTVAIYYCADVSNSELVSLHNKTTQKLALNLSLAYASLVHQLPEPPSITSSSFIPVVHPTVSDVHWLYSDPAYSHVKNQKLIDTILELISKSFHTDITVVLQTCDLLCIGGSSTAVILTFITELNMTFDADFSIQEVYQAVCNGRLLSLVTEKLNL